MNLGVRVMLIEDLSIRSGSTILRAGTLGRTSHAKQMSHDRSQGMLIGVTFDGLPSAIWCKVSVLREAT